MTNAKQTGRTEAHIEKQNHLKIKQPGGRNHKKKEGKFHQISARVKQPKNESKLSKQQLSNFQAENPCYRKQLKTEIKNRVAYNKYQYLRKSLKQVPVVESCSLGNSLV